jgi:hypothetical protein
LWITGGQILEVYMTKKEKKERAVPNKPWEIIYNTSRPSKNMEDTQGSDFAPKCPSDRKTTYVKVNREDH